MAGRYIFKGLKFINAVCGGFFPGYEVSQGDRNIIQLIDYYYIVLHGFALQLFGQRFSTQSGFSPFITLPTLSNAILMIRSPDSRVEPAR